MPTRRPWSAEDAAALAVLYPDTPMSQLIEALGRTAAQIYAKATHLGLHRSAEYLASDHACRLRKGDGVGTSTRFRPGQVPANKGLRRPGWAPGRMAETQFKPGERSGRAARLYQPIGAERISKDGYLERKVNNGMPFQRRWCAVHRLVWEKAHGAIPPGHAVVFRPGRRSSDRDAITVDALELITRAELMARNTLHNYPKPIAQAIQLRGALNRQINRIQRQANS